MNAEILLTERSSEREKAQWGDAVESKTLEDVIEKKTAYKEQEKKALRE